MITSYISSRPEERLSYRINLFVSFRLAAEQIKRPAYLGYILSVYFLIFVPQGFPWRILRCRGCLWTPM